jgi:ATP-dependent Lon protease
MRKAKERIVEYIAVRQRPTESRAPYALRGSPRNGEDQSRSVGRRGARRHFVRISLGGVRDEAEIRGHRKTTSGLSPGRSSSRCARRARSIPSSSWTR